MAITGYSWKYSVRRKLDNFLVEACGWQTGVESRSLRCVAGAPKSGAEEKTGHSGRDDKGEMPERCALTACGLPRSLDCGLHKAQTSARDDRVEGRGVGCVCIEARLKRELHGPGFGRGAHQRLPGAARWLRWAESPR